MPVIACPQCGEQVKVFLIDNRYDGPMKCAGCHGLFKVRLEGEEVKWWQPMTEEELRASQELDKLKSKFKQST